MKFIVAAFSAALCLFATVNSVVAQDVTLTSRDKSIEISGNLLGFDGTYYRVDTVYGELTVDGTGVLCEGPACPNLEAYIAELTFSGTPIIGRVLLPALIEGYARGAGLSVRRTEFGGALTTYELFSEHDLETIGVFTIKQTSNDEGFADILSNEADVAMALRAASDEEIAFAVEAGYGALNSGAQHEVIAMDALVPTVDRDSGVTSISMTHLAGLLDGSVTRWRELGEDSDAHIQVVLTDSVGDVFQPVTTVMQENGFANPSIPNVHVLESSPLSLDLAFYSSVPSTRRAIPISDRCGIAHASEARAIKALEYPLSLPMYLYRPMRRMPKIGQDFFNYLDGTSAKRVVERAGFQAIDASEADVDTQGRRLANAISLASAADLLGLKEAVNELKGRRLLSLVFRFDGDGDGYDANSSTSMKRLVRLAESGGLDGQSLLFVGFGVGEGLAEKVAMDFQTEFPAGPGVIEISTAEFGEVMPVACPDTELGKHKNTRVEVWVR